MATNTIRRKKRLPSTNSSTNGNTNNNDWKVIIKLDTSDEDSEDDKDNNNNNEIHILDGVEYKNYNNFVIAKRRRNEEYLRDLGFHKKKKENAKKKRSSGPNREATDVAAEGATPATTPTSTNRSRLISPSVSSYYECCTSLDGDGSRLFGVSLDGASLATDDPFDQISSLLLKLEREQQMAKKYEAKTEDETKSKKVMVSLLEKLHTFLSPSSSSDDNALARETYIEAFYQLHGISPILRSFLCEFEECEEVCDGIVRLCLKILGDVCCLSVPPTNVSKSCASEKVALQLASHDGALEILRNMIADTMECDSNNEMQQSSTTKARSTRRTRGSPNDSFESHFKINRQSLEAVSHAWGVYANLTYFESVTASMGKEILLDLADLAYFSFTTLDYQVTEDLANVLPLCPSENETKKRGRKLKKPRSSKSQHASGVDALEESKAIAIKASRILEPILGTIKNIVADPLTRPMDWEAKSLVSKLLDVVCKGQEDEANQEPQPTVNDNDWLHFVQQTLQSHTQKRQEQEETPKKLPATPPTLFRWMEQNEAAVWELLGIFKVCLAKGILSTFNSDVERLVVFFVRCLQRFGASSSRITLRIIGLVEGLLSPSSNGVHGSSSSSVGIWKQIILREGFSEELLKLLNRYSFIGEPTCLPSIGETVRTKIEAMISTLRLNEEACQE